MGAPPSTIVIDDDNDAVAEGNATFLSYLIALGTIAKGVYTGS